MRALARLLSIAGIASALATQIQASEPGAELLRRAEEQILLGQQNSAIKSLQQIVRDHRQSKAAPMAQFRIAQLYADNRQQTEAFDAAQKLIDDFPASDLFSEALVLQFTVVERVMDDYRKRRLKGDKSRRNLPKRESACEMLQTMLQSGRYAPYAPLVHYRLAVAYDEDGKTADAIREFHLFVDTYPGHPLADDASFQAAFIDYRAAREPSHERGARQRALTAFGDFLERYPKSEKAPEAQHLVAALGNWEDEKAAGVSRFYRQEKEKRTMRNRDAAALSQRALLPAPEERQGADSSNDPGAR